MENKTCTSCGLEKTVDDFYKRPNRKTQTHSMCKKCFNNYCTDRWVQKKIDAIKYVREQNIPFLGICLGMQLMTNFSEEGDVDGLGLIDAQTKKFQLQDKSLKIPHMGWNEVSWQKESPILNSLYEKPRYYFVHSYFVECNNQNDVLGTSHYGQDFVSVFQHDNIIGMQFHPEKSHQFGMELLQNFTKL